VRAPGRRFDAGRGRIVEQLTESVDVMPTILDVLGRSIPVQCDGSSLKPFLLGRSPHGWRQEAFWELDFRDVVHGRPETELKIGLDECSLAVLRSRRFKYIHFTALPPLFFDLEADPDELRNLASDDAHAPLALGYAQKLLSHRMAHAERTLTGMQLTAKGLVERARSRARGAA
jgi:arylsulfatase A-like enzyme